MDPASIKAFKDLEFLKSQLQGLKGRDQFTDVLSASQARENRLRELVLDLHSATELQTADKRSMSLGDLLAEASQGDAYTYTGGKQQKPDYKISADDLAKKSKDLQKQVRSYSDSLERINELETEVYRHKKSSKMKDLAEHPKTRMKVIWDDSEVSPLKLDSYRTR